MNNDNSLVPQYRFPEFKNDGSWKTSAIMEVAEIKGRIGYRGYTTSDIVEKGQGAITLSPSNIIDGKLNFDKATYISWEKYNESPEIMLEKGQTVLVKTASVGKTAYVSNLPEKTTLNPQIVVLKPYDKINKKLLSYCIAHDYTQREILNKVGAGAIPNLSQENIGNIQITYPSNPIEQQKITACLRSLDDVIAGQEEKITALEEHKKGLIQNLFPQEGKTQPKYRFPEFENDGDWVEKKLGKVAEFFKGKGISKNDIIENGQISCIRYGELYTTYAETILNVISKTNIDKSELLFSLKNDVIIPSSGETQIDIATASCVMLDNIALGGDLNVIRTKINGVFLSYYLNSTKKLEIAKMAQGNAVVHLYNHQLATLSITFPKPKEQQKIAEVLSSVDELIVAQREKIEALKEHKKGLMQGLFPKIES